jgi:acyl-ACP thioesterase
MNRHVNNVNYIEWGLESIPDRILRENRLSRFEIAFKAESNYGDRIESSSKSVQDGKNHCFLHMLRRESDRKELARMRSIWVPSTK